MSGYDAAKYYNAIKLHFNNEKYNAITYRYNTKISFVPENQFYSFQRLYKTYKDELINFYVANFYENPKASVFDLCSSEADEIYKKWKKRNESLTYVFKEEVNNLLNESSLNDLLLVKKTYPVLMVKTMQEEVSIDTLLLMDSVLQFFKDWNNKIKEDVVWKSFKMKSDKYRCFMNIDLEKYREILKKEVKNAVNK